MIYKNPKKKQNKKEKKERKDKKIKRKRKNQKNKIIKALKIPDKMFKAINLIKRKVFRKQKTMTTFWIK